MVERASGTVVKLMPEKGFGFIAANDGTEYFFHRSALSPQDWATLAIRQPVTFRIDAHNPKGPRAEEVEMVE